MDNKINNVSFNANLLTKMKGRHNIVERVGDKFAQKTLGTTGDLYVFRDKKNYPNAIVISLDKKKDYILGNYGDLFGAKIEKPEDINDSKIESIATSLYNILIALKADVYFDKLKNEHDDNLRSVKAALRKNSILLEKAKEDGNAKFIDMYKRLVESHKNRYASLLSSLENIKNNYVRMLKYMAKEEPMLDTWKSVVIDDIQNLY